MMPSIVKLVDQLGNYNAESGHMRKEPIKPYRNYEVYNTHMIWHGSFSSIAKYKPSIFRGINFVRLSSVFDKKL